ncbi:asparagine synthase (glutamine-hydrolyzing) [Chitinophaga sp. RAB17]|uniref:asparagine synthase (glutamine-hydrolyzing) n=1 Tax=Chitinophaga sp. RAB17 TaxID=3233049 RepID=UPI003F9323CF
MCGISGVISPTNPIADLRGIIEAIVSDQYRRGPDKSKIAVVSESPFNVVFGHNRLSIVDLSQASDQPLWDHESVVCITFNGEIYNFLELKNELLKNNAVFKTSGDTEVLLEAYKMWGISFLSKLNGMFSFALFDKRLEKIFIVRDRFGVKPLYYHHGKGAFTFASTTRVIAEKYQASIDYSYLSKGIRYYIYEDDSNTSSYNNIYSLKPGHFLAVSLEHSQLSVCEQQYYHLQEQRDGGMKKYKEISSNNYPNQLEALLHDAVKIRLRADVPVAISLSGGLDSSILASIAAKQQKGIVGFHYGHPDAAASEGPLVAKLAKKIKIDIQYCWPKRDEIIEAFYACADAQEAPYAGPAVMAQNMVYKLAAKNGIKVLLGGQGGDEFFMGYRKYQFYQLFQFLKDKKLKDAVKQGTNLLRLFWIEKNRLSMYIKFSKRYFNSSGLETLLDIEKTSYQMNYKNNDVQYAQLMDIYKTSLPTLLRYEDRNSMYHSMESRLPFMDYRLAEFAFSMPNELKVNKGYGKWALRSITEGQIPDEIRLARYKRGFDVSQNWYENGLGGVIRDEIRKNVHKFKGILPSDLNITARYSDKNLRDNNINFVEASTLLWLARKY